MSLPPIGLFHYLVLALCLFCFGLLAVITRRHALGVLLGIELMLNAANIAVVAFSRYLVEDTVLLTGHVFALFVMVVAAAEAATTAA
mgnify:CR=1 FL=1